MSQTWRSTRAYWCLVIVVCVLVGSTYCAQAADHLKEIKKRGVLLWGADAEGGAPYVYSDPQRPEQYIGFEHELAEALGVKLGVKPPWVKNKWNKLSPDLGRAISTLFLTGSNARRKISSGSRCL